MQRTTPAHAAWIPDDYVEDGPPPTPYEELEQLAVDWTEAQCRVAGTRGTLVTSVHGVADHGGPLAAFGRRHDVTTPRSARRTQHHRSAGPVLVYVPDVSTFDFALSFAGSRPVCVLEGALFPLRGWAQMVGAVDLTTGVASPLDGDVAKDIDRLVFYGNNGYASGFGRNQATRVVADMHRAGRLDREILLGAVLARGVSDRAVKRLDAIIERVTGG